LLFFCLSHFSKVSNVLVTQSGNWSVAWTGTLSVRSIWYRLYAR